MRGFRPESRAAVDSWSGFTQPERVLVMVGSLLCACILLWIGRLLGVPREAGFNGSLVASGSAISGISTLVISLMICVAVAGLVATFVDVESGLFCCCAGLAALAVRCGPMRPVLQYADGPGVFISMAFELVILAAAIYGVWFVLQEFFVQTKSIEKLAAPNESVDAALSQKLLTTGVQVVVMGICEIILIQSDAMPQAMAGVCVSAFLGVMAAYMFTALPEGIWYWIGPVIVGIAGYLLAYFSGGSVVIGDVHGWAAALGRATPLDYAGMGMAGAMLGYWCSRRWAQPEESESIEDSAPTGG